MKWRVKEPRNNERDQIHGNRKESEESEWGREGAQEVKFNKNAAMKRDRNGWNETSRAEQNIGLH